MSSYVPPHMRGKKAAPQNLTRRVRFVGNVTGNADVAPDTGVRHTPRPNARPTRKVLKHTHRISANKQPLAPPTTSLHHMPATYRKYIFDSLPYLTQKKKKGKKPTKAKRYSH